MLPTQKAEQIYTEFKSYYQKLNDLTKETEFDHQKSKKTFNFISTSIDTEQVLSKVNRFLLKKTQNINLKS